MGALTHQQESRLADIRQEFGSRMKSFESALPSHIKPERFLRTVMTALMVQPKLLAHPVEMLLKECLRAAQDGLMPDGKEAALVPRGFGNNASVAYQPMIAGIRKKARNSGEISTWDVFVAHENDLFKVSQGLNPNILHEVDFRKPRGDWFAIYSVCVLKDGTRSFDVMTKEEIHRIRDRSDAYKAFKGGHIKSTPWDTDEIEMGKKTVARRHSKSLPMSSDLDRLIYQGDDDDAPTIDYGDITAAAGGKKGLQAQLEQLGAEDDEPHDPETNEIGGEPADDGAADNGRDRIEEARKAGYDDQKAGKAKRNMPKAYRDDDDLAAAYSEGFEAAKGE